MNVSELAYRAGIAPSAVRFYERRGILPPPPRGPNGYRDYGEADLCRVRVVASLRRLDVSLIDAGRLAALCASGQCDAMTRDLLPLVRVQREAVARHRRELDLLDRQLEDLEVGLAAEPTTADLCRRGGDGDAAARLLPVPVPVARVIRQ